MLTRSQFGSVAGVLLFFGPLVLEVSVLRWRAHLTLGQNITRIGVHGNDVYFPLLLGAVLGLVLVKNRNEVSVRFRKKTACLNGLFFCFSFIVLNFMDLFPASVHMQGILFLLLLAVLGAIFTSVFVFHSFGELRLSYRRYGMAGLFPFVAALILVCYPPILEQFWPVLSYATARSSADILTLLGLPTELQSVGHSFVLWHPRMSASVNMGCSGLEGIFFFLFAFFVLASFKERLRSPIRFFLSLFIGLGWMFTLNLFRIVLFFCVAVAIEKEVADRAGAQFFEWAFHENLGWVIYLIGLVVFFRLVLPPRRRAMVDPA